MGWVDAIVFALVAVYFINIYLFQNYQIPTSSLENFVSRRFSFVSKASYDRVFPIHRFRSIGSAYLSHYQH